MKSGELRHYPEFQKNVAEQDEMGGVTPEFVTQFRAFCSIEPIVGREWHAAQMDRSGVTHTIKVRYNGSIDHTWRVKDGDVIYENLAVMNIDTRNREIRLAPRTGDADNG